MTAFSLPASPDIQRAFEEEVTSLGGDVTHSYLDEDLLFLRSTFPDSECIRPEDAVNRGVALRANQQDIAIHPYVFRQVCRNGAIMAQTTDCHVIQRCDWAATNTEINDILEDVCAAVRTSASLETFQDSVSAMRHSRNIAGEIELLISIAGLLPGGQTSLMRDLMQTFFAGHDQTQFGVVNAITAVARETRDPQRRWQLEEYGGGILARLPVALTPLETRV